MLPSTQIQTAPAAPARGPGGSGTNDPAVAPVTVTEIPEGGGRIIIDREGNRTTVTTTALPPDVQILAQRAEETAFGLMGLLAAIIILGPFARMWARRIGKRAEMASVPTNDRLLQQQLVQLQQSVDAMSLEVERISESQRFQNKLVNEKRIG